MLLYIYSLHSLSTLSLSILSLSISPFKREEKRKNNNNKGSGFDFMKNLYESNFYIHSNIYGNFVLCHFEKRLKK